MPKPKKLYTPFGVPSPASTSNTSNRHSVVVGGGGFFSFVFCLFSPQFIFYLSAMDFRYMIFSRIFTLHLDICVRIIGSVHQTAFNVRWEDWVVVRLDLVIWKCDTGTPLTRRFFCGPVTKDAFPTMVSLLVECHIRRTGNSSDTIRNKVNWCAYVWLAIRLLMSQYLMYAITPFEIVERHKQKTMFARWQSFLAILNKTNICRLICTVVVLMLITHYHPNILKLNMSNS